MRRLCQPGALDDPPDLLPQQRNRVRIAIVGKRGEEPQQQANADHLAARAEAAQTDRIHVRGAMDRGSAVRFRYDEEFTPAYEITNIGRQRCQIAERSRDRVSFVAQNPEWPAELGGDPVEHISAVPEKGEIVVVEPAQ